MMQIYADAIRGSRKGPTMYIVRKGLDMVLCKYDKALLSFLREGYILDTKVVSGVPERSWQITADTPMGVSATEAMSIALFGDDSKLAGDSVTISMQEFYDDLLRRECIYMYITVWKKDGPATLWVTPKDKVADPEGFATGQKNAEKIMDLIRMFRLVPYTRNLLHEMEINNEKGLIQE